MAAYQICVRCENRWPVGHQPLQWCPGCHGLLLSPVDTHIAVPPSRRNFRWVARTPGAVADPSSGPRPATRRGTPSYAEMPRWGLLDEPVRRDDEPTRADTLADLAPTLLVGTAAVFALAALAEGARYALLLFNRTRLVDPLVLALSDAAVWATQIVGLVVALAAAGASALRVVEIRRRVFAARGRSDPRPTWQIVAASVVPGVNAALPGVYLTEAAGDDPRLLRAVRGWWVLMVVNTVLAVVVLLWRQRDTLQARADAVLLTALLAVVAAAVAVATLWVLRLFDDTDLRGRPLTRRRFTVASGPANAPVAPIAPPPAEPAQRDALAEDAENAENAEDAEGAEGAPARREVVAS